MTRNRYPLPLIPDLTDRLVGVTVFSKLDVRQAYDRVRMAAGHEYKTTFKPYDAIRPLRVPRNAVLSHECPGAILGPNANGIRGFT